MRRIRLTAALIVAVGLLVPIACSGDDSSGSSQSTSNPVGPDSTGADASAYVELVAPATPQCIAIGRRFAFRLPAEPSQGLRWQGQPLADPAVLAPVGSEFLAGSAPTSAPTTTTSLVVDDSLADEGESGAGTNDTSISDTSAPETTTTLPLPGGDESQRLSYAAKGFGVVDITMVYVHPDGTPVDGIATLTWTITVTPDGMCPAPVTDTTGPVLG